MSELAQQLDLHLECDAGALGDPMADSLGERQDILGGRAAFVHDVVGMYGRDTGAAGNQSLTL